MKPWNIIGTAIGWLLLAVLALVLLATTRRVLSGVSVRLGRWKAWRRSRSVAPIAGQRWMQGDAVLTIERITDTGRIVMRSGSAGWSDSPDDWKLRVSQRRLFLIDGAVR